MKEKIKKILFIIAEIGTVIWAIKGMLSKHIVYVDHFAVLLSFFLSAVLILYLLKKYERKN